jgi:hypothetical protein
VGEVGWWERAVMGDIWDVLVEGAVMGDRWDVLFWVKDEGLLQSTLSWQHIARVAETGNLKILKWIKKEGYPVSQEIICHASAGGHVHILNWVMEKYPEFSAGIDQEFLVRCYVFALERDHVDVLTWLFEKFGLVTDRERQKTLWREAAYSGNLNSFEFLRNTGAEWAPETFLHACGRPRGGSLNVKLAKWLRKHGCPWNEENLTQIAAQAEDLQLLKWFRKHGAPWHDFVCAKAAGSGNFELLKWAHENGCPWDKNTCARAAASGNLEILKWVRERGCPWTTRTCIHAVNNLDVLIWAFQNGCPYSHEVLWRAAKSGNMEVLTWIWETIPEENFDEDRYRIFKRVTLNSENTRAFIWLLKKIAREKASELSEMLHELSKFVDNHACFWREIVEVILQNFENGHFFFKEHLAVWSRSRLQ